MFINTISPNFHYQLFLWLSGHGKEISAFFRHGEFHFPGNVRISLLETTCRLTNNRYVYELVLCTTSVVPMMDYL